MFNPTKRNRNIGTAKQGYSQNNKNIVPTSRHDYSTFWEKLSKYTVIKRSVNHKEYKFLVEKTRKNSIHPCTIDDLERIIKLIPAKDLEELNLIILRQPKRREETLKPVWGRLIYYLEIDEYKGPAIMLESFDLSKKIKWSKSQSLEDQKEFKRLISDGHEIIDNKREFIIKPTILSLRNTMLFRTFIHEVGHYVEYLEKIDRPFMSGKENDINKLWRKYDKIPHQEKEQFAHNYVERIKSELIKNAEIPFVRMINKKNLKTNNLEISDFIIEEQ